MDAEPDLLNGFAPRVVPVIRDALAKNAGNSELERALHRLGYLLVLAKRLADEPRFDDIFERELLRSLPELCVTAPIAEIVLAAIDLDGASIEDVDECVPRRVWERRKARLIEAVKSGR